MNKIFFKIIFQAEQYKIKTIILEPNFISRSILNLDVLKDVGFLSKQLKVLHVKF